MLHLSAPASKSLTHRALLLAARSVVPCRVVRPLLGADCRSTLGALRALGASVEAGGDDLVFTPTRGWRGAALDCGNSGTTLRLLTGQCALLDSPSTLDGDASLRTRPNAPLLDALAALGATIENIDGHAPLTVCGPLRPGPVSLGPRVSSQYASSLLLALALGPDGTSTLHMHGPVSSRPYLQLTEDIAALFGVHWTREDDDNGLRYTIVGGQQARAERVVIEGDWSSAAFPLVAAAITGTPLQLHTLNLHSAQGDRRVVDVLRSCGVDVNAVDDGLQVQGRAHRSPGRVDLGATPDMFPALCALAATLPGTTELYGAPSLRHKESDRIRMMAQGLDALGVPNTELPGGLRIEGAPVQVPAHPIESAHDHRIFMAFSTLGLVAPAPLPVAGAGCEAVSYPDFTAHLARFR